MKLNRKWLHEDFVDLSHVSDKEYVETLTVFGQKVETYERMDAEIKNVVVGKVVSIVRHENSDQEHYKDTDCYHLTETELIGKHTTEKRHEINYTQEDSLDST